jgi:hypothetical protein
MAFNYCVLNSLTCVITAYILTRSKVGVINSSQNLLLISLKKCNSIRAFWPVPIQNLTPGSVNLFLDILVRLLGWGIGPS